MNLLIDCGNSSLKLALSKDLVIDESYSIEFRQIRTFKDNVKRLLTRIKRQNKLDGIYIIYVNKEMKDLITPILLDILVKTPIKLLNRRSFKTFNLKYKNLSSFGIDRFYTCLGGKALYKSSNLLNLIIVFIISFGAIILILDTFQIYIAKIIPNIEFLLYSLYETFNDIRLFLKDLI